MTKNLVICCDGTGNRFEENQTNVLKLHSALSFRKNPPEESVMPPHFIAKSTDSVGPSPPVPPSIEQRVYYAPGVGTFSPTTAWTRLGQAYSKTLGLALGVGYRQTIVDAYRFLMQAYCPGDRVFLFGFSRGAYTARIVAAMIHAIGILTRGNEQLIPYALSELESRRHRTLDFERLRRFRNQFSLRMDETPFLFLGVWDTVSSISWAYDYLSYAFTAKNPSIAAVRHAVAIDESRAFFVQNLFRHTEDQDIKEVWFAGSHSDVGGGHRDEECGLSKIALEWMAVEARDYGLELDARLMEQVLSRGETVTNSAMLHRSMRGWWRLAEFFPKQQFGKRVPRPHLFRKRTLLRRISDRDGRWTIGKPVIHESAVRRFLDKQNGEFPAYSPSNWPESHEIEPWRPFSSDD